MQLAMEELSERVNGDMRMALNQLQYMSLRSQTLKYTDVHTRLMASAKDEDVSPFSAVDKSVPAFKFISLSLHYQIVWKVSDLYTKYR